MDGAPLYDWRMDPTDPTDLDTADSTPEFRLELQRVPKPELTITYPDQLAPELAQGLAVAQSIATTVDNDGYNTWHKYKYPTQAAIAERAREAFEAGGLFLMRLGSELVEVPEFIDPAGVQHTPAIPAFVRATYILGHSSGHRLPDIKIAIPVIPEKGRPIDKATAAALTLGHKYLLAGLLNMGWRDPSEDVDQRNDSGGNKPGKGARQQQQQQQQRSSVPPQPKPQPQTEFDVRYSELRSECGRTLKYLASVNIDANRAVELGTGSMSGAVKGANPSQLVAIIDLGKLVASQDKQCNTRPKSHLELAQWASTQEHKLMWSEGNPTARGKMFDEQMTAARTRPAGSASGELAPVNLDAAQANEPVAGDDKPISRTEAHPDGSVTDVETGEVLAEAGTVTSKSDETPSD